jgi:DNA (cytosine-5)-methyltransferase 1
MRPRRVTWDVGARDAPEAIKRLQAAADRLELPYAVSGLVGAAFIRRVVEPADISIWIPRDDPERWAEELMAVPARSGPGRIAVVKVVTPTPLLSDAAAILEPIRDEVVVIGAMGVSEEHAPAAAPPHIVHATMGLYTLIDLFAGCGGMTLGFRETGRFRPVLAVECEQSAAETYRLNFGEHVAEAPIEDVARFPRVDLVIGGPPCQGFSPLNRDLVGFERRGLWREYLRALRQAGPQAFVMENVPELLGSAEYAEFKRQAQRLGFTIDEKVLNAADYGVPQRRRRAIVIGVRSGVVPWPTATHFDPVGSETGQGDKRWVTFREAVAGLPQRPDGKSWHRRRNPRPESVRRYKAVPRDGGDRFAMQRNLDRAGLGHLVPRCWREKPTGTTDVFGRLWWDRPACTIRTEFYKPEKGRYLHPSAHRPITLREAARCMSFPDDFVFPEHQAMTSVARQIGNAVPPLLARRIAESLADMLSLGQSSPPAELENVA